MAAALLAVIVSSTQPFGALADHPALDDLVTVRLAVAPEPERALDRPAEPEPEPDRTPAPAAAEALAVAPAPGRSASTRPAPPVAVRAARRPATLWRQLRGGLTVTGVATWYPGSRGYAGIAHVAMPGASYLARGQAAPRVRVCAGSRCTIARVVDACACRAGTSRARLVDLSATTLRRLGLDPSRGVYAVRVTLLAP